MATLGASPLAHYTVEDLERVFHVKRPTITRWIAEGKLPRPIRPGRRLLFPSGEVDAYLARLSSVVGVAGDHHAFHPTNPYQEESPCPQ
jgi:excisionase family DNA binding protein